MYHKHLYFNLPIRGAICMLVSSVRNLGNIVQLFHPTQKISTVHIHCIRIRVQDERLLVIKLPKLAFNGFLDFINYHDIALLRQFLFRHYWKTNVVWRKPPELVGSRSFGYSEFTTAILMIVYPFLTRALLLYYF